MCRDERAPHRHPHPRPRPRPVAVRPSRTPLGRASRADTRCIEGLSVCLITYFDHRLTILNYILYDTKSGERELFWHCPAFGVITYSRLLPDADRLSKPTAPPAAARRRGLLRLRLPERP